MKPTNPSEGTQEDDVTSQAPLRPDFKRKPKPANFTIQVSGAERKVPYESLFIQGHELWIKREFSKAFKVFDLLSSVKDRGPRAAIVKAHCAVMNQKFSESSATLWQALPKAIYSNAAAELHDIFVMWRFKFYDEVRQELERFVSDFPELPTPALLLGEFYSLEGQPEKAKQYLKLAQERDRDGGAVGTIAIAKQKLLYRPSNRI